MLKAVNKLITTFIFLVGDVLLVMAGMAIIIFVGFWSLALLQLLASELGCAWFMELTSEVVVDGKTSYYLMRGPRFVGSATVLGLLEVLFLVWVTLPDPDGEDVYR